MTLVGGMFFRESCLTLLMIFLNNGRLSKHRLEACIGWRHVLQRIITVVSDDDVDVEYVAPYDAHHVCAYVTTRLHPCSGPI